MRTAIVAAALAWASLATAGLTPEQKCQDAIAGSAAQVLGGPLQGAGEVSRRARRQRHAADCATDLPTLQAIGKAETKLRDKLAAKCPGGLIAQTDLGLACKGAASVRTSTLHHHRRARASADLLIDTAYHTSGQITDPLLRKCQKTLAKALLKGSSARQKARGKCAKPIALVENPPTICPDEKAFLALDKARTKLITIVEAACSDTQVLDAALKFGGDCGDDRAARRAARSST
jgi:hypothetical protein